MKRIGLLVGSTICSEYFHKTITSLIDGNSVEVCLLLNTTTSCHQGFICKLKSKLYRHGVIGSLNQFVFGRLVELEYKVLSLIYPKYKDHRKTFNIESLNLNNIIHITPVFSPSGLRVHYGVSDIEKIKSLNLDLMVRVNAPGIFTGDILKAAKKGIISFHHGDNRWNRGGPAAFWEVYLKKPSTGFVIQILSEELDGGLVVFRGNLPTSRTFTENSINLYIKSNPHLSKIILDILVNDKLPTLEIKAPFTRGIYTTPTVVQSLIYITQVFMSFIVSKINSLVARKRRTWGVAFVSGHWEGANLRKGIRIENPKGHFFADPFVVTKNNRTVCFVEDYMYRENKGCIAAIEIVDSKNYKILGPVVMESFHMSFPYVFNHEGELYMVPETSESNSIRLYKCIDYPMMWEYQHDIMIDVDAADTMLFSHNNKYWMFSNISIDSDGDHSSKLMAYYRESMLSGDWVAHENNPIVYNCSIGRNAGILNHKSNDVIRCRQKYGFNHYGAALTLARITDLSPSSFHEEEISEISPEFFENIDGCHHMHSDDNYTVYDYSYTENK